MQKIFSLKSFWAMFAVSAAVICVALINLNKTYRSEASVILVMKSGTSAIAADQIVENIAEIPRSMAFFNRILEADPLVFDADVKAASAREKRDYWRKTVKAERIGESGFLKISASGASEKRSRDLLEAVIGNLIESVGIFYDTKSEINIRLVDAPASFPALAYPFWSLVPAGIVFGFLLAFVSFAISFSLFGKNERLDRVRSEFSVPEDGKKDVFRWPAKLSKSASLPSEEAVWPITKKEEKEEKVKLPEKEKTMALEKKAAAPTNLPVAPENLPLAEEKDEADKPSFAEATAGKPIIKEATPEEVKERLNKLLSGKL